MTRIALVVSDVDGTLLTKDKVLTDKAARAVRRLEDGGVAFTVVSSRPTIGMRFLIEPMRITMPFGSFNGSSITDPQLKPIEQHVLPASAAQRSLEILKQFGVDVWLFTNDQWLADNPDGEYNPLEKRAIKARSGFCRGFCAVSGERLQDRRLQFRLRAAGALRGRHAAGGRHGGHRGLLADTIISTSPRRAATRAPSSRRWPNGSASRPRRSPPSATCRTIWRCFARAACRSRWATRPTSQAAGHPRHGLERGRGLCRRDRNGDEAERRLIPRRLRCPANARDPYAADSRFGSVAHAFSYN